jgi:hypothetical protein
MSADLYTFFSYRAKEKKLKRSCSYALLSEDIGVELLEESEDLVVVGGHGIFHTPYFSYFFKVKGLFFYFESNKKFEVVRSKVIESEVIELSRQ